MIRRFFTWLVGTLWRSSAYSIAVEDDTPNIVKGRTLYLIGEENHFWLAVLKCPCGCGDVISLPMSANARPCWRVSVQGGKPSLFPSVHRTAKCRSHFVLKAGRIIWCHE
ncbi:DUF6527 family protein [Nitrogeniibacter aestuarii]|uniref:DUF6527 family protein n=1 Tax=Nitrogeniibacter aestuarii TaxID=2815343 RepID=UPI001D12A7F7